MISKTKFTKFRDLRVQRWFSADELRSAWRRIVLSVGVLSGGLLVSGCLDSSIELVHDSTDSGHAQGPASALVSAPPGDAARYQASARAVEIGEVWRRASCNTAVADTVITPFADQQTLNAWQAAHGLSAQQASAEADGPFALIELGRRAGSGYGLAVSRRAYADGSQINLAATFFAPKSGAAVQAEVPHPSDQGAGAPTTSPCVLISLPKPHNAGGYTRIVLRDPTGGMRAQWPNLPQAAEEEPR